MKSWGTFVLLAATIVNLLLSLHAKQKGRSSRDGVISSALIVAGLVIIIVRERLGDVSVWIEVALSVPMVVILVLAFWKMIARFRTHLRDVGLLSKK